MSNEHTVELVMINWADFATKIVAIERDYMQAGATRLANMAMLAATMPVLDADGFEKNLRKLLRDTLENSGIDAKSVPAIVSNCKVALIAMTNGILPEAGEVNIRKFVERVRPILQANGSLEISNKGAKKRPTPKAASNGVSDATTDAIHGVAYEDRLEEAISFLASAGDPSDKQYSVRREALLALLQPHDFDNAHWDLIIQAAQSITRRKAA